MADLLSDETIDSWIAANLWAAMARRRSLVVVAGANGVGKSTLLSALLEFLPPGTRRLYLRGCFETFAFLSDPTIDPRETAVLINEISPHLPVYLWGPAVRRTLGAARQGFQLLSTAHADSVPDLVGALTGSPLRLTASEVAALEFVVMMERAPGNPSGRHVSGVWRLAPTRYGVSFTTLPIDAIENDISLEPTSTNWFPQRELAERQKILENLGHRQIDHLPPGKLVDETEARDGQP